MDDKKKHLSLILALRPGMGGEPEGEKYAEHEGEESEMESDDELHAIASELIAAVKHGDTSATVEALRAAFLCLDAKPHVEGKHLNEMEEEGEEEPGEEQESYSHEVGEKYGHVGYSHGGMARKRYAEGGVAQMAAALSDRELYESKLGSNEAMKPGKTIKNAAATILKEKYDREKMKNTASSGKYGK